jgi:hypothetical protein
MLKTKCFQIFQKFCTFSFARFFSWEKVFLKITTFLEIIELVSKLQHFSLKEEKLCLEEYRRKIGGHGEPAPTSTPSTGYLLLLSCG